VRWCSSTKKSQIQALDRTQPGLPLKRGRAATLTHDYVRHGTTTLFAALETRTGRVIGDCRPRHRAKEFIRFLRRIFFAEITTKRIRRGAFTSVAQLEQAIRDYLDQQNADPSTISRPGTKPQSRNTSPVFSRRQA
jgi:hypothetical protein